MDMSDRAVVSKTHRHEYVRQGSGQRFEAELIVMNNQTVASRIVTSFCKVHMKT